MRARNFQGRMANLKSVLPPERVVSFIASRWPDAAVVWATHDEEGKVRHAHFVVRWPSVVRWSALADWLHAEDGHEYAAPAGSWRRSVRYLLHLDNPEKARIPREALGSCNIDESELAQLLTAQRLPILESLILAEGRPLHERFAFLVIERGHAPSEISSALRCMMDLERWAETRCHRGLLGSALPSSADVRGSAALAADEVEAQSDCPEDDFSVDLSDEFPSEEAQGSDSGAIASGPKRSVPQAGLDSMPFPTGGRAETAQRTLAPPVRENR